MQWVKLLFRFAHNFFKMHEIFNLFLQLVDFVLHVDKHLLALSEQYGTWMYLILFLIIFCETGLVVTPFLPGDSLLFVAGMLCINGTFSIFPLIILLIIAAFLGNFVNYQIGRYLGPRMSDDKGIRFINKKYLAQTHEYFEKHGKMTVFLSRFVPIIRTFVPFVAGIGKMRYKTFISYTILGGVAWIVLFIGAGFFLGNIPIIRDNVSKVAIIIVIVSVIPAVLGVLKKGKK